MYRVLEKSKPVAFCLPSGGEFIVVNYHIFATDYGFSNKP